MRAPPKGSAGGNISADLQQAVSTSNANRAFFNALPASVQEQIAEHIDIMSYYRLRGNVYEGIDRSAKITVPLDKLPSQVQDIVRRQIPDLTSTTDTSLSFLHLPRSIELQVIMPDGRLKNNMPQLIIGPVIQESVLQLDQTKFLEEARKLGRNASPEWKVLASYQEHRVWPNDSPMEPVSTPIVLHYPFAPRRRADELLWLADKTDMEYVSDYYSSVGWPMTASDRSKPLTRSLKSELDHCAAEMDISWKKQSDGVYLFRNNRWYRDDLLEVPASQLTDWMHKLPPSRSMAHSAPPAPEAIKAQLDLEAEFISKLSLFQIANGLYGFVNEAWNDPHAITPPTGALRPFAAMTDHILSNYGLVKLYASLNMEQRNLIAQGRLPFETLTSEQQQQALALTSSVIRNNGLSLAASLWVKIEPYKYNFTLFDDFNPGANLSLPPLPLRNNLTITAAGPN